MSQKNNRRPQPGGSKRQASSNGKFSKGKSAPNKSGFKKSEEGDKKPFNPKGPKKPFRRQPDKSQKPEYRSIKHPDDGIRLNKYLANAGICSRREADKFIEAGLVEVNGEFVTALGTRIKPTDEVKYGGETISTQKPVYILLNKPKGYITTNADPQGRNTVLDLVYPGCQQRVFPVGRLDRQTTGLLMLTNDGDLAKKLTHPKRGIRKVYRVTLDKNLVSADLKKIADGIDLEDGKVLVDEISYLENEPKKVVGLEIHSGKNRIVRRIFEALGYTVVKLDRNTFGELTKKNLERGHWRYLTPKEVGFLKMM